MQFLTLYNPISHFCLLARGHNEDEARKVLTECSTSARQDRSRGCASQPASQTFGTTRNLVLTRACPCHGQCVVFALVKLRPNAGPDREARGAQVVYVHQQNNQDNLLLTSCARYPHMFRRPLQASEGFIHEIHHAWEQNQRGIFYTSIEHRLEMRWERNRCQVQLLVNDYCVSIDWKPWGSGNHLLS